MSSKLKLLITVSSLLVVAGLGWVLINGLKVPPSESTGTIQMHEQPSPTPSVLFQDKTVEMGSELPPDSPRCLGTVAGEAILQRGHASSLKQLLSAYPLPKMWLAFHKNPKDCNVPVNMDNESYQKVNVQLPKEAMPLLGKLWVTACTYYYYGRFDKGDINARKARSSAMSITNNNTSYKLMELTINTPDGKRKISRDEAFALMRYTNDRAKALISNLYGNNEGATTAA